MSNLITMEKLTSEADLNKIEINKDLLYFLKDKMPIDNAILMAWCELKQLWIDEKYLLFCFSFGPVFEYIIYTTINLLKFQIYEEVGKESKLPRNGIFYENEIRSTKSNFSNIIECLKSDYKKQRFTDTGFNQKPWSALECFKYQSHKILDTEILEYFIKLLEELESLRNSFAHGNFKEFSRKSFNDFYFDRIESFEFNLNTGKTTGQPKKESISFVEAPDMMVFVNLGSNKYFKKKIKRLFVHLSYILTEIAK
jgi:hypothetical protein